MSSTDHDLLLVIVLVCLIASESVARPIWSRRLSKHTDSSSEYGQYFEGDLAISDEQISLHYGDENALISSTGIRDLTKRWPGGKVYYQIDSSVSSSTRSKIQEAMNMWSSKTCITFAERDGQEPGYVYITSPHYGGCFSDYIGYSGEKQTISLQDGGCTVPGIIAHEIGHNLGLWHEHTRPDRDEYVIVKKENIIKADMENFIKRKASEVNTQGLPYDFGSIMHYRSDAFSKNGEPTIEVKNQQVYNDQGSPMMGQREHLSEGDALTINRLYNCPGYQK